MQYYAFAILWPLFLKFCVSPNKHRKMYVILAFIPFLLFSGLRGIRVGTDTYQFTMAFNAIAKADLNQFYLFRYESLFLCLNKILSFFSNDPHILIVASSLLIIIPFIYGIIKFSDDVFMSSFLYGTSLAFFLNLNLMRQGIASSFLVLGTNFLLNGKWKKFILFSLIGSLFHYACFFVALICILVYKLKKITFSKILIFFGGTIIAGLSIEYLVEYFFPMYLGYLDSNSYKRFLVHFFLLLVPMLFFISRSLFKENKKKKFYGGIFFAELILLFLSMFNANFCRIVWYLQIFFIFSIPNIFCDWSRENKKTWMVFICLCFVIYLIVGSVLMFSEYSLLPYEFMWNESVKLESMWVEKML